MNINIVRAATPSEAEIQANKGFQESLLPEGFPFLVDSDTQVIVEPVLHFFWDKFLKQSNYVENTALAYADDLRDWHLHLNHFKLGLFDVGQDDIEQYRDLMLKLVSPRTHEFYSASTVSRRVGAVVEFYRFAFSRGWVSFEIPRVQSAGLRSFDSDMLAHVGQRSTPSRRISVHRKDTGSDAVRAFTSRQYRVIAQALGPLPSQQTEPLLETRDRLWAELCLNTGMRPDEPSSLTAMQVLALQPNNPDSPTDITFLQIKGKGSKFRKVEVPNHLLKDLIWYIENEREASISEGRRRGHLGRDTPTSLFLNSASSRHNSGCKATYETFRKAFHAAIVKAHALDPGAGLMGNTTKTDPDTLQNYTNSSSIYGPHCLRHTYAVWTYLGERKQGNAEPWKLLQTRLGHAQMSTTVNTYLRLASEFESQLSDRLVSHIQEALMGDNQ